MIVNKINLEIWIITNTFIQDDSITIANMLISHFDLDREKIGKGISIALEYKDTPLLMQQKIVELFIGDIQNGQKKE